MKMRLLFAGGLVATLAFAFAVVGIVRKEAAIGSEEIGSSAKSFAPERETPMAPAPAVSPIVPENGARVPTMATIDDPELVYQRAFWRRTVPGDTVIHAQRREWFDAEGRLVRWQWFIVFKPARETLAWLQKNPFILAPVESWVEPSQALPPPPAWFPGTFADHHLFRSPGGHHALAIARDGSLVYGTDSGTGFAPTQ